MSELDDALAMLERAVARLEAAPLPAVGEAAARLAAAADESLAAGAVEIVARVDAALDKIGRVLSGEA